MACCFRYKLFDWEEEHGCQFTLEKDFTTLGDGDSWCRFHLPMRDAAGNESPKASWDDREIDQFNKAVFDRIDTAIDAGDEEDHAADLRGVIFPGNINFRRYDKKRPFPPVCFRGAAFSGYADFHMTAFSGHAKFREAAFSEDAEFIEAAFSEDADFGRAAFSKHAVFREADFSGSAIFRKAAFSRSAYFGAAAFSGYADFSEVAFSGRAYFSGAAEAIGRSGQRYDMRLTSEPDEDAVWRTEGEAVLPATPSRSTFRGIAFYGAVFGGSVTFNNRRFTDETSFRGAIFERAPKFHNAVLHQDTDFTGAKFLDVTSEDAVRNYRTLKLAMENVRARQEESIFFALEQRSLRNQPDTPWMVRWASAFYDWAAEYGLSFLRPVRRIAEVLAGFWLAYWALFGYLKTPQGPPLGHGLDIVLFTLQQVLRPFEVWNFRYPESKPFEEIGIEGVPLVLQLFATAETLIVFGLFALFLLALRKRFRML